MKSIAAESASLPFWFQVAGILLAPILGFFGVASGVALKDRSDRRNALRQDRYQLYTEFLRVASELHMSFGRAMSGLIQNWRTGEPLDEEKAATFAKTYTEKMIPLEALRHQIELIGSKGAAEAANAMWELPIIHVATALRFTRKGFQQELFGRAVADGLAILNEFREAAARDLGVSKSDRRRRKARRSDDFEFDAVTSLLTAMQRPRADRASGQQGEVKQVSDPSSSRRAESSEGAAEPPIAADNA